VILWSAGVNGTGHRRAKVKFIIVVNVKKMILRASIRHDVLGEQRREKQTTGKASEKRRKRKEREGGQGEGREGGEQRAGACDVLEPVLDMLEPFLNAVLPTL
jgi:hypothetical protein